MLFPGLPCRRHPGSPLAPLSPLAGEMSPSGDRGGWGPARTIRQLHFSRHRFTPLCPGPGHLPLKGGDGCKGQGLALCRKASRPRKRSVFPGRTGGGRCGLRPHKVLPLSPLAGEMSPKGDRGGWGPARTIRRLHSSRHRFTPLCPGPGHLPRKAGDGCKGRGRAVLPKASPPSPRVTPDAAERRSGAHSFAERRDQGPSLPLRQAGGRVGPGSALALGRDDSGGSLRYSPYRLLPLSPSSGKRGARHGAAHPEPRR